MRYYTIEEIIFGLRSEYIKSVELLKELQKRIVTDEKVASYKLVWGNKYGVDECEKLIFSYELNHSEEYKQLIDKILKIQYLWMLDYKKLATLDKSKHFYIIDRPRFTKKVSELLKNDEFLNSIEFINKYRMLYQDEIQFSRNSIRLNTYDLSYYCNYNPERIYISAKDTIITPKRLEENLKDFADINGLDTYHNKIISQYNPKEIYLEKEFDCNSECLKVQEDSKRLILTPTSKPKRL